MDPLVHRLRVRQADQVQTVRHDQVDPGPHPPLVDRDDEVQPPVGAENRRARHGGAFPFAHRLGSPLEDVLAAARVDLLVQTLPGRPQRLGPGDQLRGHMVQQRHRRPHRQVPPQRSRPADGPRHFISIRAPADQHQARHLLRAALGDLGGDHSAETDASDPIRFAQVRTLTKVTGQSLRIAFKRFIRPERVDPVDCVDAIAEGGFLGRVQPRIGPEAGDQDQVVGKVIGW